MTAFSIADPDCLYQFLAEYIATRGYGPNLKEIGRSIHRDFFQVRELLVLLEQQGRIRFLPWKGGRHGRTIVLARSTRELPELQTAGGAGVFSKPPITLPKPGRAMCQQCRETVSDGKTLCAVHLRLAREANKRSQDKKRGRASRRYIKHADT